MQEDYIKHWEELIDAVEKSIVPFEFINRIYLNFQDPKFNKTIDVASNRNSGKTNDQIEELIEDIVNETRSPIVSMDFALDIETIATMVQIQTEKLLKNIP